jgi:hypothetical protein
MIFPRADEEGERNGWTYDYEYTYQLSEYTDECGDSVTQEQIEYVLEAIEKLGTA